MAFQSGQAGGDAAPAPAPPPKPAAPEEKRPSAVGPPETKPPEAVQPASTQVPTPEPPAEEPEPAKPEPAKPRAVARGPVPIMVPTNPPGATVSLDGRADTECRTPCTIMAPPGRHSVSITLPGHMTEYRQIDVGNNPQELPLISLRGATGTLMLNTAPPGATILIDGKPWSQGTPAQINLNPGTYNVTVEKNGRRATERVEIRSGSTTYRKIPLE